MEENVLNEVRKLVPQNITHLLPAEDLDSAVLFLLQYSQDRMTKDGNYAEALKAVEAVLEITWEELNTGHWSKVPPAPRQLYTAAAIIKIDILLRNYQHEHGNKVELLKSAVKTADLGILLGAVLSNGDCSMTRIASLLSHALSTISSGSVPQQEASQSSNDTQHSSLTIESIPGVKGHTIKSLEKPSLEQFRAAHFGTRIPVKLTGCMSHWPALLLWKDLNYLRKVAGARTVPIELGAHYVHPTWSQKLMTVGEFIAAHIVKQMGENTPIGYLAQHPLLEQVPELMSDICEPEYCCLSDNLDEGVAVDETDINAWFGPKGTVSPLHHDPKHNLLAQVVGEKRILLYHPDETGKLYPHEGSLLNNTAQVNPEEPDYGTFPNYENAVAWECHLKQGEILYIPPKWWHHVRSLSTSFSVSFWWT
ncbi:lysine-specific demethylase 8 [Zootermopsis nevadensis]|uniref:JmjC domain-containing protein 5 n=1 Tax=Zootermopsis nevadensis TaxID=136037 RepID=A0A067QHS6_ZOONE|nr:lysine-specific demethylase 8 [Zootermopsis nevadensis]KDR07950.1 JmjC domain-containing protein 5 [Zootermopsis nevadensis]